MAKSHITGIEGNKAGTDIKNLTAHFNFIALVEYR